MNTETKHTPLPWFYGAYTGDDSCHIGGGDGKVCGGGRKLSKANAAVIVRAVNSHGALLEALKEACAFSDKVGVCYSWVPAANAAIAAAETEVQP